MNKSCCPKWSPILTLYLIIGLMTSTSTFSRPSTDSNLEVDANESSRPAAENASRIRLKDNHPKKYTVKKGDTLWEISSIFLKDAWYWPEIWQKNPQLDNPHLIYPGDVLTLIMVNGKPKIIINESPMRLIKASPQIRRSALEATIPVIPGDAIRQFVIKPRVLTKKEFNNAAYILGSDDEHLVLTKGNRVYVRGELDKERVRYTVYRPSQKLRDPDNNEVLGYEAIYAGEVHIKTYGDPAIGTITYAEREILIGDRLLPIDKSRVANLYQPHVPEDKVNARVVSLFDALFGAAKYQVAVINRGSRDGLEVGHILASFTKGKQVKDNFYQSNEPKSFFSFKEDIKIVLPDERSGIMMVFRTFDQVSYALIMESTNIIQRGDAVRTPD